MPGPLSSQVARAARLEVSLIRLDLTLTEVEFGLRLRFRGEELLTPSADLEEGWPYQDQYRPPSPDSPACVLFVWLLDDLSKYVSLLEAETLWAPRLVIFDQRGESARLTFERGGRESQLSLSLATGEFPVDFPTIQLKDQLSALP